MKLKMMRKIPSTEKLFEKEVKIKRIDIFDIDVKRIETFLREIPNDKKLEVINIADKAIEGKIIAFSSTELDYGNPINWHYNPNTKVEVSNTIKWYRIPDFDPKRGDIKIIWEASRFTHFIYFARAYLITKEKKYYKAFSEQLNSWIKENSYSYGVNYKCGQESTLRMINALMTYSVFKSYGFDNQTDKDNLRKLVEGSYKKVLSNFFYTHKCIKNNHTLSEITGLIIGAWCSDNKIKLKKAYCLLNKEIKKQFSNDGGYIQNSFNYQRLALQLMEFNLKISDKTKLSLTKENQNLIKNSAQMMYQLQNEAGDIPNRGANDGALIFPVTSCNYRDFRSVINSINCILENERLYQSGIYDEEILWFLDKKIENIPVKPIKRTSKAYSEAGIFSLRSNEDTFLMTILKNNKTRPSHMDQLHIDLWHKGINIFCDNGSYSYADQIGKKLALTSSHNTVKVNGVEQMNKKGAFLVTNWSKCKDVTFTHNSFRGTMISKNGYQHTRTIKKNKLGYSITDNIMGDGEFCEFYFHTPCDVKRNSSGFELYHEGDIICSVTTKGDVEVRKAYKSLYYLKKEEISCVTVKDIMSDNNCSMKFDIELKHP
ncbi:heparinase II/III domain-containing protein [Lederbergia citrea]|uniref:Heparinase II/III family protein n=1 Tax=Lederbergia citrea TaxID=2833581 RepID=A0A942Z5E6_9BACI|nr:heparinase II/III family protein [Lederbergia citrea]MBS4223350.1 heparinase II/III family protein [Lederbergia citrea]